MNNFSITFIDPFIRNEQELGFFNDNQLVTEFIKVPWYQNIMDSFYDLGATSPPEGYVKQHGDAMVENEYWHFGIKSDYLGEERVLYLIPNYASHSNFKETDIRFSIEYSRPKKEKTSRLARFFGAPPEKTNPNFLTHITDVTFNETCKIITEFGNQNLDFLNKKIYNEGGVF